MLSIRGSYRGHAHVAAVVRLASSSSTSAAASSTATPASTIKPWKTEAAGSQAFFIPSPLATPFGNYGRHTASAWVKCGAHVFPSSTTLATCPPAEYALSCRSFASKSGGGSSKKAGMPFACLIRSLPLRARATQQSSLGPFPARLFDEQDKRPRHPRAAAAAAARRPATPARRAAGKRDARRRMTFFRLACPQIRWPRPRTGTCGRFSRPLRS